MLETAPTFTIAGVTVSLQSACPIHVTESFAPFCSDTEPDWRVIFRENDVLPTVSDERLYVGETLTVASDGAGGFLRVFRDRKNGDTVYAHSCMDAAARTVSVDYLSVAQEYFSESGNSFFHIGWESILFHEGRMMLHAACVDTPLGGILFTGPSGAGKSTQAELWCRYGAGRLLNGDRAILQWKNDTLLAHGSPYAGSSRVYVNECRPVRAIVSVKQAPVNAVRELTFGERFRVLFPHMTVNSWDPDFVSAAMTFAEDIAARIPVFELSCTAEEAAVKTLRDYLMNHE